MKRVMIAAHFHFSSVSKIDLDDQSSLRYNEAIQDKLNVVLVATTLASRITSIPGLPNVT